GVPPRRAASPRHTASAAMRAPSEEEAVMARAFALDHIVLVVSDIERSLAWYGRHAGLEGVRVDEWRRGEALFPSLRVDAATIIDLVPGAPTQRGQLYHIRLVVSRADLD